MKPWKVYGVASAVGIACILAGCGGSSSDESSSESDTTSANTSAASGSSTSSSSSASSTSVYSTTTCPSLTLSDTDAQTLTGDSTPISAIASYGVRNYSDPEEIDGEHDPANYLAAPVLPTWQFATTDPTSGVLTDLECDVGPDVGWHSYHRTSGTSSTITHGKVIVTGGRSATIDHIYTVYNGQQLVAAINDAGLSPKIIRVVGHIDLRWSANNTVFKEYTSYKDQKFGGSIMIPSNTTLVGINDAEGNPARITGTTLLIGAELGTTDSVLSGASGDAESDFKKWIAAGYDGDDYPTWTRNIIIRNLKIDTPWDVNPEDEDNAYADGITISRAQNIWLDHLTVTDGDTPDSIITDGSTRHDGALDIVRGSDYVTVSDTLVGDHGKTTLVGNGDSGRAWSDENRLHVTFTGMWWYGTGSRLPLVRYGQLHTFNNLVEGTTDSDTPYGHKFESGLNVRYNSSVLTEDNFYLFTGLKVNELCGKIIASKSGSEFATSGNYFISDKYNSKDWSLAWTGPIEVDAVFSAAECSELPTTTVSWTPPYSYTPVCAPQARRNIEVNAGAGRIGEYAVLGSSTDTLSDSSCYEENVYSADSSSSSSAESSSSSSSSSGASSSSSSASSSLPAGTVSTWSEDFTNATTDNLLTTSYQTLPADSSIPMYQKLSGTLTVADGVITMTGARLSIGAYSDTVTDASTSPGGIFNIVGYTCSLNVTTGDAGVGSGKFQIYVDNNSTSSSASIHGSSSRVYNVVASTLTADTTYTVPISITDSSWPSGAGSFIALRTESSATANISALSLSCN